MVHRALFFDFDMVPYTQHQYEVDVRVTQIIDERTGRMLQIKTDAIMLKNVFCRGRYSTCRRFCPRAIPSYWREVWLERVSENRVNEDEA